MLLHTNARKGAGIVRCQPYRWAAFSGLNRPAGAPRDLPELSGHVVLAASQVLRIATRAPRALLSLPSLHVAYAQRSSVCPLQEAILQLKRCDWVRPLLDMLESHARKAPGLTHGQKVVADHLFDIILNKVSCPCPDTCQLACPQSSNTLGPGCTVLAGTKPSPSSSRGHAKSSDQ